MLLNILFIVPLGAEIIMDEVSCPSLQATSLLDCRADLAKHNCHEGESVVIECYNGAQQQHVQQVQQLDFTQHKLN